MLTKAHKRFKTFTKNDKLIKLYEAHQKWIMDRDTAIGYAEMKGIEQGIEQCIEQGIESTAIQMLKEGLDEKLISEISGIPLKEVRNMEERGVCETE